MRNKILLALIAFVTALGLATAPASAATVRYTKSTSVTWGSGTVSALTSATPRANDFVGTVTDNTPSSSECVGLFTFPAGYPNSSIRLANACGGSKSFVQKGLSWGFTEFRIYKTNTSGAKLSAYSTLR